MAKFLQAYDVRVATRSMTVPYTIPNKSSGHHSMATRSKHRGAELDLTPNNIIEMEQYDKDPATFFDPEPIFDAHDTTCPETPRSMASAYYPQTIVKHSLATAPYTPPPLKIKQLLSKSQELGILDSHTLCIVTLAGHEFTQLYYLKRHAASQNSSETKSYISNPLDFIKSNITHDKVDMELNYTHHHSHKAQKPFVSTHCITYASNELTTTDHTRLFHTGSKTSINLSLRTYTKIGNKCSSISKKHDISNSALATFMDDLQHSKNSSIPDSLSEEDVKYLTNTSSLLFLTETSRHKSAYITHKMFIDLVKADILCFKDMHTMLPMAIKGAVQATLAIDKAIFTSSLHNYKPYYETKSTPKKTQSPIKLDTPQIKEFTSRTTKLVNAWLSNKEYNGTTEEELYQFIKEHIIDWYGTKNRYGDKHLLASCAKLEFDLNTSDSPQLDLDQTGDGDFREDTSDSPQLDLDQTGDGDFREDTSDLSLLDLEYVKSLEMLGCTPL